MNSQPGRKRNRTDWREEKVEMPAVYMVHPGNNGLVSLYKQEQEPHCMKAGLGSAALTCLVAPAVVCWPPPITLSWA